MPRPQGNGGLICVKGPSRGGLGGKKDAEMDGDEFKKTFEAMEDKTKATSV